MVQRRSIEDLNAIITAVGPLDDTITDVVGFADGSWGIKTVDGEVFLEYDPDIDRLMFSLQLGNIAAGRRQKITEVLIAISLLWRKTGGLHAGMSGPDGPVWLMVDLAGDDINPKQIATVATNLVARQFAWRAFVTEPIEDRAAPALQDGQSIMLRL